ncbi:hypothetical protein J7L24_00765 [bacterium]|nr:hypothetical protein [bacterium]
MRKIEESDSSIFIYLRVEFYYLNVIIYIDFKGVSQRYLPAGRQACLPAGRVLL